MVGGNDGFFFFFNFEFAIRALIMSTTIAKKVRTADYETLLMALPESEQ